MVITNVQANFDTFIERCVENGVKVIRSECLSDDIMGLIGEEIQKLKQTKKNKEKFNIVLNKMNSIFKRYLSIIEELQTEAVVRPGEVLWTFPEYYLSDEYYEEEEEEEYDSDNEEHSHECQECPNNAPDDQWLCGKCR